tara:strand:+ start:25 stop:198 length:174 start_codon:yes stop_codon:yes gene_type:complete
MLTPPEEIYEDDCYPRGAKKFHKPSLKGEITKEILRKWIKSLKDNQSQYQSVGSLFL